MRGRTYTKELKEEILREVKEVGNVSLVARKHRISKSTIFTWIKESENRDEIKVKPGIKTLIEGEKELKNELTEVTKENDQLKRILGAYTVKQYKVHKTSCNNDEVENIVNREFDNRNDLEIVVSDLTYVNVAAR
ncbi:transposase [Clostridium prolinivorans]|uniref:transposase n=1 Tax=Clostridium prolinivorans TaxID=2769420 RepID=UPI001D185A1E|nr:transposase [Clostridium prolinivorans]